MSNSPYKRFANLKRKIRYRLTLNSISKRKEIDFVKYAIPLDIDTIHFVLENAFIVFETQKKKNFIYPTDED